MSSTPAGQKEAILKQAYTELVKAERGGDYERALKASNRILKTHPQEETAFHCKVVSLIQLSKFQETLLLLKKTPPNLTGELKFEKSYCEYRLNRCDEAMKTLESLGENMDFRCQELVAQLLYRQERYAQCQQIYRRILKDSDDSYDQERRANLLAVDAQLAEAAVKDGQTPDLSVKPEDTYEQHYNHACSLVAAEDYDMALNHLDTAEKLCRETLTEDGVADDEIEEEVVLIKAQQAFCKQMAGDVDGAMTDYTNILKQKPSDPVTLAVASNNMISARKEQNLFDARKKLKTCQGSAVELKLTTRQKRTVCLNNALVQLHSNQFEPCRRILYELRTKYGAEEEAALIEASLYVRQKEIQKGIELLTKYKCKNSCSDEVQLALSHLNLTDGKVSQGMKILQSLEDLRWTPGILSLIVSLSLANEQDGKTALEVLSNGVEYYSKNKPTSRHMSTILEQSATLHARFGDHKMASKYLEELRKIKPNDRQVLARLIQIYSQFDPEKAEEISQAMPPLGPSDDSSNVDIETLENSEWILFGEKYRQKKEAKQTPKPGILENADQMAQKTRKKKRKNKLPKNMDPNILPDPERWLPKYERTANIKRLRKYKAKDKDVSRGTQGAVGGASAEFDSSNTKPTTDLTSSPKPSAPTVTAAPGPRQQRPGGQQKAKKKKKAGNKW